MDALDKKTAAAFSTSWNTLPEGSTYTYDQIVDWFSPLGEADFQGKTVLEMGCGNGSHLCHLARWNPRILVGIDLGDSVRAAKRNVTSVGDERIQIVQADLNTFRSREPFDVVFCIGVLHHLQNPGEGFRSVIRQVKPGGRFHCWVYGYEGNEVVRYVVDPLRKIVSMLPWWFTKFLVALPLGAAVFGISQFLRRLAKRKFCASVPLNAYFQWISNRDFRFHWHVVFDQLVTPTTHYIRRETVQQWLDEAAGVDPASTYLIHRNGNSWKFGGRVKAGGCPGNDCGIHGSKA